MGIPFRGVMHNSGLCGGSQLCHGTDQKQIKETEKTTLPTPQEVSDSVAFDLARYLPHHAVSQGYSYQM